jgi:GNAT superfamily N-acetyltransferase
VSIAGEAEERSEHSQDSAEQSDTVATTAPADEIRLLSVGPGGDLAPDSAFAVALVTLWQRAAADRHAGDGPDPTRAEVAPAAAAAVDDIRKGRAFAVALNRGRDLLGVGIARSGDGPTAHTASISALVVDPAHARQGLGTRLLEALLQHAAARGVDRATVTVPDDPGLLAFLNRAGFEIWGRRPGWERLGPDRLRDQLVLGAVFRGAA